MIDIGDVEDARDLLDDVEVVADTPLRHSESLSREVGGDIYLKCENFQYTGAFKVRGAYNKIEDTDSSDPIIAASAGNHAQGVALAASDADRDVKIVMPRDASISKVQATSGYGAEVVLHGENYDEAYEKALEIQSEEDRVFVHPFDDPFIQAGQGTIGLEIADELPEVDTVVVPIGGGGLISGVATAIKDRVPDARVVGVQAEGASSVVESLNEGEIYERDSVSTISDGIATRKVSESTFETIVESVDEVVTVSDDETANAILKLLENEKIVAEGAGAVPLAAALYRRLGVEDENVVCVLSGGNIDSNVLSQVINRGLINQGRYLKFETVLEDKPGALVEIASVISEEDANIYAIHHHRMAKDVTLNAAEVEFELETRSREHANRIVRKLENRGYEIHVRT